MTKRIFTAIVSFSFSVLVFLPACNSKSSTYFPIVERGKTPKSQVVTFRFILNKSGIRAVEEVLKWTLQLPSTKSKTVKKTLQKILTSWKYKNYMNAEKMITEISVVGPFNKHRLGSDKLRLVKRKPFPVYQIKKEWKFGSSSTSYNFVLIVKPLNLPGSKDTRKYPAFVLWMADPNVGEVITLDDGQKWSVLKIPDWKK